MEYLISGIIFVILWGFVLFLVKKSDRETSSRILCLETENKKQFDEISTLKVELKRVRDRQWDEIKLRSVVTDAVNAAFDKNAREWLEKGWLHQHDRHKTKISQ
jgi:hypothetical protein